MGCVDRFGQIWQGYVIQFIHQKTNKLSHPNTINSNGINVDYAIWRHNHEGFLWYLISELDHISAQQLSSAWLTDPQSKYYFVCRRGRKYSAAKNLRSTEIKRFKGTWKRWCGFMSLSLINSISKWAILVCCSWEFPSAVTRTRSLSLSGFHIDSQLCWAWCPASVGKKNWAAIPIV